MATRKKVTKTDPDKKVDLPPTGPRNADPLTDAPGAHPIETGIGAGIAGAAAGLAVGSLGGPVGAVIGATVGGAVAGGLIGKGVGEMIDPTTEDAWLREYFGARPDRRRDESPEQYRDAYRYGLLSAERYGDRRFEDVEPELRAGWDAARGSSTMTWDEVRGAVRDAYDRRTQGRTTEPGTVTVAGERTTGACDRPTTSRVEDMRV